eukprot:2157443-Pleurochrysis_carterae.AAC.1
MGESVSTFLGDLLAEFRRLASLPELRSLAKVCLAQVWSLKGDVVQRERTGGKEGAEHSGERASASR